MTVSPDSPELPDSPEASLVRAYLESAYPSLLAGLLTGSVVRGAATATSDIDVVVLLPAGAGTVRSTVGWSGRTVDVFGYTLTGCRTGFWLTPPGGGRRCARWCWTVCWWRGLRR